MKGNVHGGDDLVIVHLGAGHPDDVELQLVDHVADHLGGRYGITIGGVTRIYRRGSTVRCWGLFRDG